VPYQQLRTVLEAAAIMKFVALLSGGKDSCFNIMKCQQHSHELVAVANLMPPEEGIEEMNSFMYQSAAHNTIPSIAECLRVPLFRQGINRKSLIQTLDYKKDENDEVEDLFVLLQRVVTEYPDIKGVSCGTIVSNYQRLRVEDVCIRLNLIPLTYLWQRDRRLLLDEMISAGVHAVLVKVAGAGLDPYKHLGKDLESLRPTLERLHQKFGLDLCGEGGEYETIVLDCPAFHKRLLFSETSILIDEEDCSVGNLRIVQFSVAEKTPVTAVSSSESDSFRTECSAGKEDSQTLNLEESLHSILREPMKAQNMNQQREEKHPINYCIKFQKGSDVKNKSSSSRSSNRKRNKTKFENLNCYYGIDGIGQTALRYASSTLQCMEGCVSDVEKESKAVEQMKDIMTNLKQSIESLGGGCDIRDACFIHLYLSDVKHFQAVNSEYCKWFDRNPPSRSCVAVSLNGFNVCHSTHIATLFLSQTISL
jgi:diphthine-ammonia ligase